MQDSSDVLILNLRLEDLTTPSFEDGFRPMQIQYHVLMKWMEQKTTSNPLIPGRLKEFYNDCRDQFVQIRETPRKLIDSNEKAITFLETNIANGRIAPQVKCEIKPLLFGHHAFQIEAAQGADQQIQALMTTFQTQCQEEMLNARKVFKVRLEDFDIKTECKNYAQAKWIELCGGQGQLNLYDRNYVVLHTVESSASAREGGSSAEISMHIHLSAAIFSAAYHKSGQIVAAAEAASAAEKAILKKAREEALAKKTAAQIAVANRPSAESEASIEKRLTEKITACVVRQVLQQVGGHLNHPAAPSQSTQRGGTANRGRGRGNGRGHGGANAVDHRPPI